MKDTKKTTQATQSNQLTTQQSNTIKPPKTEIKWKGNKKQRLFMAYYTDPNSDTFANAFRSGIKCGYSASYSKNITHLAPSWLSEYMENMDLKPEHIKLGISRIATGKIDSRSIDDTRLKAYELLMKIENMDKNTTTNIHIVQPILSGIVETTQQDKQVIDIEE